MSAECGEPALFPPDDPAIALAAQALQRVSGVPTAFVRSGGSIPVVAEFAARGIPTVVTGFGWRRTPTTRPTSPSGWARLDQGAAAAGELYQALAAL